VDFLTNIGTAYADDIVLFFANNHHLQNGLNLLNSTFCDFGLTITVMQQKLRL